MRLVVQIVSIVWRSTGLASRIAPPSQAYLQIPDHPTRNLHPSPCPSRSQLADLQQSSWRIQCPLRLRVFHPRQLCDASLAVGLHILAVSFRTLSRAFRRPPSVSSVSCPERACTWRLKFSSQKSTKTGAVTVSSQSVGTLRETWYAPTSARRAP